MLATPTDQADADLRTYGTEDLHAASVHLEDLEIFVGQRSRMHPGPGWAVALDLIRRDLAEVRAELASRTAPARFAIAKPPATPAGPAR